MVDRELYPTIETESAFGPVKVVITPDGARVVATAERPITINRIQYKGDAHLDSRPEGYRMAHCYMRRVDDGWGDPTRNAYSAMYAEFPKLVAGLITADPSLVTSTRATEIHNAIVERQSTIEAREREVTTLKAEIAALKLERPEDGSPYIASYRAKGSSMYSETQKIPFRAQNDAEAAKLAHDLAPSNAERYSIYSLPAAGLTDKVRDLGPSYWISND